MHVSTKQGTQGAERQVIAVMNFETQLFSTLKGFTRCYGVYSSHSQEHRGEPLLFSKNALGSFTCITQHGTNGFMSHPKDEAMVNCLLKDISVTANPRQPIVTMYMYLQLKQLLMCVISLKEHGSCYAALRQCGCEYEGKLKED